MKGWVGSATGFHSNSSDMPVTVRVASALVPGLAPPSPGLHDERRRGRLAGDRQVHLRQETRHPAPDDLGGNLRPLASDDDCPCLVEHVLSLVDHRRRGSSPCAEQAHSEQREQHN